MHTRQAGPRPQDRQGRPRRGGAVDRAAGTVTQRRVPNRSCVACRTVRPKRDLLRVVRTPAGQIVIDGTGRAAGRGAYVCRAPECTDIAIRKGALSRALKTPLPADLREALIDETADLMTATNEGGSRGQE